MTEDIGSDELIRRLKTLAHTFQTLSQADDESTYADYTPLAIHLADDVFSRSKWGGYSTMTGEDFASLELKIAPTLLLQPGFGRF